MDETPGQVPDALLFPSQHAGVFDCPRSFAGENLQELELTLIERLLSFQVSDGQHAHGTIGKWNGNARPGAEARIERSDPQPAGDPRQVVSDQ